MARFAMLGGYVIVLAMRHWGVGFVPALAIGFVVTAAVSMVFERLLYARLYHGRRARPGAVHHRPGVHHHRVGDAAGRPGEPAADRCRTRCAASSISASSQYRTYSIFLIVVGIVIVIGLWLGFERTRFGAQIRAAVDNRRMAESLGINIDRLFSITFGFGSGMAALGGGLGAEFLGLDPQYALKYLVFFLIVVAVGGLGRITGVFYAVAHHRRARFRAEEVPPAGRHAVHLCADHPAAAVAAAGPVREAGMSAPAAALEHPAARALAERHRLRCGSRCPGCWRWRSISRSRRYLGFGTELLVTILFAISLDLALGYAGIVTLGHAAFFGAGAYTVGMLAYHGIWNEPITSLIAAAAVAAAIGLASGLVLLRTTGLTLLMLTLCTMALLEEAANLGHDWTGGFDGLPSITIPPLFGLFEFNPLYPRTQYLYVLGVLFVCFVFVRTLVYSPFGQSLTGIRENTLRMHAVGAPVRGAADRLLHHLGGDRRHRRRPVGAGQRLRQSEHARPRPRRDRADHPGARRLRPALRRVRRRGRLHGARALPVEDLSDRLAARPRPAAGRHRAVRARRHPRHRRDADQRLAQIAKRPPS